MTCGESYAEQVSEPTPPAAADFGPGRPRTEAEARQDAAEILRSLGAPEGVQWLHRGRAWWIARPVEQYAPFVILPDTESYVLTNMPQGKYFEDFPWDRYRRPPGESPQPF